MSKECYVEDCTGTVRSLGLCPRHYMRMYRKGSTQGVDKVLYDSDECSVDGCNRERNSLGFCLAHYYRGRRTGSTGDSPVREKDSVTWTRLKSGYLHRSIRIDGKKTSILQHRAVMEEKLGRKLLPGENIHHINGIKDDNRPENLEVWSTSQPSGQRIDDKITWAIDFLEQYGYTVSR